MEAPLQPKKVKLVATIGPASEAEEMIEKMIVAGMNVARFNTKHSEPKWHHSRIERVRKVAKKLGKTIPILLDLQGPEVRTTVIHGDHFEVKAGEVVILTSDRHHNNTKAVFTPQEVIRSLEVGKPVTIADGICQFLVDEVKDTEIMIKALEDCTVHSRKTVNTPGTILNMPSLDQRDLEYIEEVKDEDVEYVGLSFVRDSKDIEILRDELKKRKMKAKIVAKIENQKAIENIVEITEAADVIMVARGDLGVEIPFYEVPHWQKLIIKECKRLKKPVIVATQMLLSMVNSPLPSRAEVSDVANAVLDGADMVMLSEESAQGNHPAKVVQTQAKIAAFYEQFV